MSQMFLEYDKKVWQALVAGATVSGVGGYSTNGSFRWDSNSTEAYPANDATSGALIQQIFYDKATNQTHILYLVSTAA
jgi:hypothetical protein